MTDIEYIEQKKSEIVSDHIRRCHNTELNEAEKEVIDELNWQIERLKKLKRVEHERID